MPSIFVDIVRLVLVVVGLGLLFSWVWGADVAGLFAALGVTSIVLGFALQNAVGSIISGLLLLFEQPFHLGDWLDTGSERGTRGRGQLAGGAHRHRQRHPRRAQRHARRRLVHQPQPPARQPCRDRADRRSASPIRPTSCCALLERAGLDVPVSGIEPRATAAMTGPKSYATSIAVRSPADADDVAATFLRWTWYAPRRAGLHLDGASDTFSTPRAGGSGVRAARRRRCTSTTTDVGEAATAGCGIERWASGERLQPAGEIPDALRFVLRGTRAARHAHAARRPCDRRANCRRVRSSAWPG